LTYKIPESDTFHNLKWDNHPATHDNIRKLFWSIEEESRPDYSHLFLGFNLSRGTSSLFTRSKNDECEIALAIQDHENEMMIQSLLYQERSLAHDISEAVISLSKERELSRLSINILEDKNQEFVDELEMLCGKPIHRRDLTLMRKKL
jgi:hypothetical protein